MRRIRALVAVAAAVLAGCGTQEQPESGVAPTPTATRAAATTTQATTQPAAEKGTVVTTSDSEFGEMLFAANGQAIYLFDKEKTTKPECYGACAEAWPPVLTKGKPQAGGDVDADMLGTVKRTDGTLQVTYHDHPLYFYADEAPHEVKCHNVDHAGGLWYVVQPDGNAAPA